MANETNEKQLYICLNQEKNTIFYAALLKKTGATAEFSSSYEVTRGQSLLMHPVPMNWDGGNITPQDIQSADNRWITVVSRSDARGKFQVHIQSIDQRQMVEDLQSGGAKKDHIQIHKQQVGKITIFSISGRVGMRGVARIDHTLKKEYGSRLLILLDMRECVTLDGASIGIFFTLLKEALQHRLLISILADKQTGFHEKLVDSKIPDLIPIHYQYDEAVAELLKKIIQ